MRHGISVVSASQLVCFVMRTLQTNMEKIELRFAGREKKLTRVREMTRGAERNRTNLNRIKTLNLTLHISLLALAASSTLGLEDSN